MAPSWSLPETDPWSTPFAQLLMHHLDLQPGNTVLDIAAGGGIPAFHLAEQVGPKGKVLAVDIHQAQVLRAKSIQDRHMPWLQFEVGDMRFLPETLPVLIVLLETSPSCFFGRIDLRPLRTWCDS